MSPKTVASPLIDQDTSSLYYGEVCSLPTQEIFSPSADRVSVFLGSLLTVQLHATHHDHCSGHSAQQCKQQNCLLWLRHQHNAVEAPAAVQYVSSVPQLAQCWQSLCWYENKSHGQCCGLETLTQNAEQAQIRSGWHVDWGPHYDHLMEQAKKRIHVRPVSHIPTPFKISIQHSQHTKP